jgi:glycosyltransferase involved in cell wall biosynthesis
VVKETMKQSGSFNGIKEIVMITPAWNETVGGTAKVAYNLARGIQRMNSKCRIHVITSDRSDRTDAAVSYMGKSLIVRMISIITCLRSHRPQVIHCHGRFSYVLFSFFYKILFDAKVILVCSFYTQPVRQSYLPGISFLKKDRFEGIKRMISVYCLNKADKIVANSSSLAENIKTSLGSEFRRSIEVIPSGVEELVVSENESNDFIERHSLMNAFPVFSTVGVLQWDWKVAGMLILLSAFQKVVEQWPGARLVLVGDGQYRNLIQENIARLGIDEHVILAGNLSNTFIPLAVSDIYCHMALNESCSVSILEAMISGKPVIAADAGGNREIVSDGQTGLLVNPSVDELFQAMLTLGKDRELSARLGCSARCFTRTNYNWDVIAKRYYDLYIV